ncbi:hypothetical protein DFH27DRAFT_475952 [Peziza echinospora]|nr:hypothetical protein DFH27DRAFT_475952 [Peziza echinospora]
MPRQRSVRNNDDSAPPDERTSIIGNSSAGGESRHADTSNREEYHGTSRTASFLGKFGAIELENKGSVARDHLALERTFLAWLRTSLAFASIGIAVTQLFRHHPNTVSHMGKSLGATFLGISIIVLGFGAQRYYESQGWLLKGKFPASRGSVFAIALISLLLIITSLVIVLIARPGH